MLTIRRSAPVVVVAMLALLLTLSSAGSALPHEPRETPSSAPSQGLVDLSQALDGENRPNIVLFMADDMRADDLRFMPHVRRLIGHEGVRFDNMFSPQPLCCPARASFLSGMYTHNHKVWSNESPFGFRAFKDHKTLPVWLQTVGYNTGMVGKYLNGYGLQTMPDGSSSLHYVPPGWTDWRGSVAGGSGPYTGGTYRYYDSTLNVNGRLEPHGGSYNTHVFGNQSRQMISEFSHSPEPFFLWSSFIAPHAGHPREPDDPGAVRRDDGGLTTFPNPARPHWVRGRFDKRILEAPGAAGEKNVSDKPFFIRALPPANDQEQRAMLEVSRQRAESLSVLDREVKHTIDALRSTGELDNSILVFTSDNGYFLGEHRRRNGKTLPYEPSLHVPLLIRGPEIPAGEVRKDPASIIDLAPTFLDAASAPDVPTNDGTSLLDIARHGDRGWTRGIFTETGPLRLGRDTARAVRLLGHDLPSTLRFSQGVRVPRYLYVEHASDEKELYDLRTDPGQNTNLVHRRSERHVRNELARLLDQLRDCAGESCRVPIPKDLQTDPS